MWFRVVFASRVVVRDRPHREGLAVAFLSCGEVIEVLRVSHGWACLSLAERRLRGVPDVSEAWALIEGRALGFGALLLPIEAEPDTGAEAPQTEPLALGSEPTPATSSTCAPAGGPGAQCGRAERETQETLRMSEGELEVEATPAASLTSVLTPGTGMKCESGPNEARKSMRVWLLAQGSRGDVQPFIALGVGLQRAGHQVRIFANAGFKGFAESFGLAYTMVGRDTRSLLQEAAKCATDKCRRFRKPGLWLDRDPRTQQVTKATLQGLETWMEHFHQYCHEHPLWDRAFIAEAASTFCDTLQLEGPDVVIAQGQYSVIPFLAWQRNQAPVFLSEFAPFPRSEDDLRNIFNHWCGHDRSAIRKTTGSDPLAQCRFETYLSWRRTNKLYFNSPWLLRRPCVFGKPTAAQNACTASMCPGFLVLDQASQLHGASDFGGAQQLAELHAYIAGGEAPVYVGWGSMPLPIEVLVKLIVAFERSSTRAIVCTGWAAHSLSAVEAFVEDAMPADPLGLLRYARERLLFVTAAPHEWLLQRCACAVHHAGAGTTCAALRAGVPMIVTPFIVDQPMWADWISEIGVGLTLSIETRWHLLDPSWSQAVLRARTDSDMRARAQEWRQRLRQEDGVGRTVALLEAAVGARGREEGHSFGRW